MSSRLSLDDWTVELLALGEALHGCDDCVVFIYSTGYPRGAPPLADWNAG